MLPFTRGQSLAVFASNRNSVAGEWFHVCGPNLVQRYTRWNRYDSSRVGSFWPSSLRIEIRWQVNGSISVAQTWCSVTRDGTLTILLDRWASLQAHLCLRESVAPGQRGWWLRGGTGAIRACRRATPSRPWWSCEPHGAVHAPSARLRKLMERTRNVRVTACAICARA